MSVHFSSRASDRRTPPHIIERVLRVFGGQISLDPCADALESVPALVRYKTVQDGVRLPWFGNVYVNPPYGKEVALWVDKFLYEAWHGTMQQGIMLLAARTDTQWFRRLRHFPRVFLYGRLCFGDATHAAPFPSMLAYFGISFNTFYEAFADIGDAYLLYRIGKEGTGADGMGEEWTGMERTGAERKGRERHGKQN